jgi:queuine tRNA-ribosyltransferase
MFSLLHTARGSRARAGLMRLDHGEVPTPIFMPVGTLADVKAIHKRDLLEAVDAPIILGNTYHLFLRPGLEVLEAAGGLHGFARWPRCLLTDSGGYQVYSLAHNRRIDEEGVDFKSHLDGTWHRFTPENAVDIQRRIGADIVMAFDECPPYPCSEDYARASMALTHRWLDRCLAAMEQSAARYGHRQHLFPIVQGSVFPELRRRSAEFAASREAPGYAIGGLSVGEPAEEMYRAVALTTGILPTERPRYLMGVGTPENLLECIDRGVDMFDCVMPTRNARNGMVFTPEGILNMRNEKWRYDQRPLNDPPLSFVDRDYSRAYIRHLLKSGEMLGGMIATVANLAFYLWLMREARRQILNDRFALWKTEMLPKLTRRL